MNNQNITTLLPDIELTENKLILTNNAVQLLGIQSGDRVCINYYMENNQPIPLIGTPDMFGINDGNKLTKTNTVSYRGEQNKFLQKYGTKFVLEKFKSGFKLKNAETNSSEISLTIINK
ncbi:MAG: hypothetical protein SPI94_03665 [Candidatus Onthovivens sp.]|jgi:hypothetical protein|nr:hypothetical protein [Mollicutes bacterium]MCI7633443.1 hypothetical protein [Mollicutes bacterium]MDY5984548.1 hypothetical protein [Candidatus Onthovivens sp.]